MSAEQLRRAAVKLREHAELATAGPWKASPVDSPRSHMRSAVYSWAHETGTPESEVVGAVRKDRGGGICRGDDARYIALMHPPVALALASWLDEQAAVVEGNDEHDGFDLDLIDGTARAATQVARAILREDS